MIRPKYGNRLPKQFKVINTTQLKHLVLDFSFDCDLLNLIDVLGESKHPAVTVHTINLVIQNFQEEEVEGGSKLVKEYFMPQSEITNLNDYQYLHNNRDKLFPKDGFTHCDITYKLKEKVIDLRQEMDVIPFKFVFHAT